jgi:P-type Ca2+ transporter type 2C
MSTTHRTGNGRRLLCVKGSPPEVLALCDRMLVGGKTLPLDDAKRLAIQMENERMAGSALRVLGFAYKETADGPPSEYGLTWTGLAGMADPVRPHVRELIGLFHRAGVETVLITGDQSDTAYAVAQELNLSRGRPMEIMDATALDALAPEMLQALATKVHVFARVSPAHKLKIVQALQAAGRTVAMTGDGINDGPALKAADIGIAMGREGTDVARDIADIVLQEDQLEFLAQALAEGRTIHSNIRKSVRFFLSTNISEVMLMFTAMSLGVGFPLNVMQLLWINLISDIFPGLALAMETPEADVMQRPPRDSHGPLFDRGDFSVMTRESAVITSGALAAFGYGALRHGAGAYAGTMAFQSLTIAQLLHALACRSENRVIGSRAPLPPNPYLTVAIGGSLALQALTMVFGPLRRFLGLTPPGLMDLAVLAATTVLPLVVNETLKPNKATDS